MRVFEIVFKTDQESSIEERFRTILDVSIETPELNLPDIKSFSNDMISAYRNSTFYLKKAEKDGKVGFRIFKHTMAAPKVF